LKILLAEPEFPIPTKGKNCKNYLPIGLLKLAAYCKDRGDFVRLARGNLPQEEVGFRPDEIWITSLFTYWREYVKRSVEHYRKLFPSSKITVGGIYASLMPDDCKTYTQCDEVFRGIHDGAEKSMPAYDLIVGSNDIDFQIVHTSRGCIRNCRFCGAGKIEPTFTYKDSIKHEICSNKLIFYDNNLLANPRIKDLLHEIADSRFKGKPIVCESQCGFDGRLLTPELAFLIKKARFQNPRLAWDGPYSQFREIKKQIDLLVDAGYRTRDIFVFMLYNWELNFSEMEKKRKKCLGWQVQIADCRFRPLDQRYDRYDARKAQTNDDYYIHPKWTDEQIKRFRKNVRIQNICIRMGFTKYSQKLERKGEQRRRIRNKIMEQLKEMGYDAPKVRQIIEERDGWVAHVRIAESYKKIRLSSEYRITGAP